MKTAQQKIREWAKGYCQYVYIEKNGDVTSGDNLSYDGGVIIGVMHEGKLIPAPEFTDDKPVDIESEIAKIWEAINKLQAKQNTEHLGDLLRRNQLTGIFGQPRDLKALESERDGGVK